MNLKFTKATLTLSSALLLASAFFVSGSTLHSEPQRQSALAVKAIKTLNQDHFVALGDWGAGTPFQKAVAEQLIIQHGKKPFNMVLMLGDNIYPVGDIKKFATQYFEKMYRPLLSARVKFLVALGNHDVVAGHGEEQVKYFKMPGNYYEASQNHIDFFIIDSNTFADSAEQQSWLKKSLAQSNRPWRIVLGHHPVYSSGVHGIHKKLKETLEPILADGKVQFYLAGHDHDYERFDTINGVVHIVSGGGGAYLRNFDAPPAKHSLVRLKKHHFLDFEANASRISLTAIDATGAKIDAFSWQKSTFAEHNALQKAQ